MNARGQMIDETLGSELRTTRSFDPVSGWLGYIHTVHRPSRDRDSSQSRIQWATRPVMIYGSE